MKQDIFIYDTTLRDGEQAPGFSMDVRQKVFFARALERLGVDVMEVGFPYSNEIDHQAATLIAKEIKNSEVAVLSRTIPVEIDACVDIVKAAERGRIHVFSPTSDLHIRKKLGRSPQEVLENTICAIKRARNRIDNIQLGCEDATRARRVYLYKFIEEGIRHGASVITIADTVGCTTPWDFEELVRDIRNNVTNIDRAVVSVHCHDDLGLAVANSLAGIRAGAQQVECTMNGIGERAGNAALEEIVMGIRKFSLFGKYQTNIKSEHLVSTSKCLSEITGVDPQINKAIVGSNAFRHGSGIHQHGLVADRETYEFITPNEVGAEMSPFFIGRHSGKCGVRNKLQELGVDLSDEDIGKVLGKIKTDSTAYPLTDDDLLRLVKSL
jgi:2-isopropylmalate synthase